MFVRWCTVWRTLYALVVKRHYWYVTSICVWHPMPCTVAYLPLGHLGHTSPFGLLTENVTNSNLTHLLSLVSDYIWANRMNDNLLPMPLLDAFGISITLPLSCLLLKFAGIFSWIRMWNCSHQKPFQPKMQQISFSGRALSGPTVGAYSTPQIPELN